MEVEDSNYSLISSPYDSFMRKHLQHYGYFTGRSEIVKKYGFIPSKPQLISSSSDSDSSSDNDEPAKFRGRGFVPEPRIPLRQNRIINCLNLRSINDENSFEPRWPIEVEVLPEARVKHIDAPPKQPELFYKPTTDHGPFVRSFDENNGRVVYNYQPETCGYFVRSRIGGNREGCRQAAVPIRNAEDTTAIFESRFESGNLMKAVQVGEFEYELYLRYDLYTKRNTQWFYFRLQNIQANKRYRFTIVNFFKSTSLYSNGMRPLMYSVNDAESKNIGWRRWGEEIVYYKNNLTAPDNPSANMYSLTWTCKFPNENDTYYFAHCYPYTYSDLQDYLNEIQTDHNKSQYCKQKVLCRTLAGNFVYMLTITSPTTDTALQQRKKGVVVTARVHPGETNASWMMKGLLDFLLDDSSDAKILRDNFIFKIVPMLNPDGVIVGNYRCSLSGRDLNRNYKTILKDAYPSIWHTREMIKRFMSETELVLYCDFHGHSRKQNVFIYGCENKHLPGERLKERIFPAMLSKNDPTKFSYPSCKFKVQKSKEGTGRIVMWSMGIRNSYTLEATFCGSTQGNRAGHQFNNRDLESIGYHFLDSLLDYCDPDNTKRDRLIIELQDNLRQMIQAKLLSRGINPGSLTDIDIDQYSSEDDSSDDVGSDSSADDGLPKHLEVIAAAKVRLKKTRKKTKSTRTVKDAKRKEEIEKENLEKNKPVGLPLSKNRTTHFPSITLLETSVVATENNGVLTQEILEKQQRRKKRRDCVSYLVCQCSACMNARIPRTDRSVTNETSKPTPPISTRRSGDASAEVFRYDVPNEQSNRNTRWPVISRAHRLTPADEKQRRTQFTFSTIYGREYSLRYSSMPSSQTNVTNDLDLVNDSRDAFTATYLLRRLNTLFPMQYVRAVERESIGNTTHSSSAAYPMFAPSSRIDEATSQQTATDNENELDGTRMSGGNQSDDGRQQTFNNYVTNRVSLHLNDRILGSNRPFNRPKSSSITSALQTRTILDIRAIQPPIQQPNPKRLNEQHQRQRAMMVFGKQNSTESLEKLNSLTARSMAATVMERRNDETPSSQENVSLPNSKLSPLQPDNAAINLVSRYETPTGNQILTLNRIQTIKTTSMRKSLK